jgi:hypothetical protein
MFRQLRDIWRMFRNFGQDEYALIREQKKVLMELSQKRSEAQKLDADQVSAMISEMSKNIDQLAKNVKDVQQQQVKKQMEQVTFQS